MNKENVKTFCALVDYAYRRALRSVQRNDSVAWAYWQETAEWASRMSVAGHDPMLRRRSEILAVLTALMGETVQFASEKKWLLAAKTYSRGKWLVILARNNGITMPPRETGVNLEWLHSLEWGDGDDFDATVAGEEAAGGRLPA